MSGADVEHREVLVVGGGNAGISLGSRLLRDGVRDVSIVAPQPVHRYKPLLNYVAAGQATMADLERPMGTVVPDGCEWIRDGVEAVDPAAMTVRTRGGRTLHASTLVLCPGLVEDWDATPGLQSAYTDGWAASSYVPGSAPLVWPRLASLRRGSVVFTVPPEPASCGPTALKPLFMACDQWRRDGVLPDLEVRLVLPASTATGVPEADEVLERAFADYGIEVLRDARIERVDWDTHAVTVTSPMGRRVLEDVAFAHAVPHYRAPGWIADGGLAVDPAPGLVDIDPQTLRSRRYESIWAIGDAADVATRPSGGALRKQVDVLARNIAAARDGKPMQRYDGYTVMPITLSRRRLSLNEVDRDGRASPSVPLVNPFKPRRSTWLFDRHVLPVIYFRRILRGRV
jgi:sulfide:quinone oxidoreductase